MKTEIVPITCDNLSLLVRAGHKWGMSRSEGWFRRCLFDPTVDALTDDKCRGHVAVDENGEPVAVQGCYYQPLYFRQEVVLGFTGTVLGADARFGEDLVRVMERNRELSDKAPVKFGNCYASKRAVKVVKLFSRLQEPPVRSCECRAGAATLAAYLVVAQRRILGVRNVLEQILVALMRPVDLLKESFGFTGGFDFVRYQSFDQEKFGSFWGRFLARNDGLVSSRAPERMRWLFDDSIRAGVVGLVAAERAGEIYGYVMIRRFSEPYRFKTFEIIDICAVDNDVNCLKALAYASLHLARQMGGLKVLFFGQVPKQEQWLDSVYNVRRKTDHPFCLYRACRSDIAESLAQNKGWFFGPLDSVRCMGHGGCLDL